MRRALEGLEQGDYATIGVGFKLAFFLQLRDHFGWAATQEVFERYNDEERMLPVGNDAERNAWLIHVSEVVGHNLAPFMADVWGIGISEEARAAVAQLPEWMPAVGGLAGLYRTQPNTALHFDLEGKALSHDGVAEVVEVTQPARGRLVMVGDAWAYQPDEDITGEDSFTYGGGRARVIFIDRPCGLK